MNAKRIAMFVDVDNCALEYLHYENVLSQVKAEGDVVSCTDCPTRSTRKFFKTPKRTDLRHAVRCVSRKEALRYLTTV